MQTLEFQAETTRLLNLVVHSLYTNREIFLRELIANSSDALDRLRLEALVQRDLWDGLDPLGIRLEVDRQARTLTIRDNGIGMSREEVVANLGTIARSGTQELIERLQRERSQKSPDLIGRFGVGFYSAFMVAERVVVVTRRAGTSLAVRWESTGELNYHIDEVDEAPRGTAVTLHLKAVDADAGVDDYTSLWTLQGLVRRYADFVTYPISYHGPAEPLEDSQPVELGPVVLNSMKPIWTKSEADVTPTEYTQFFRHVSGDWNEPLWRMSFKAEGRQEYAALLFVPKHAPYDILYSNAPYGLGIYARRMLIVDRCQDVLPRYLRFLKGVVDVSDLPLNVSRYSLQESQHVTQVRRWLSRKVLESLARLQQSDDERYLEFWKEFGRVLKEGISEDRDNQQRLLGLALFESSADASTLTTLAGYVSRMKSDQRDIYYLTGETRAGIEKSPHLEACLGRGYEVLFLTHPVDELVVQTVSVFDDRPLRSLATGSLAIGDTEERQRGEKELEAQTRDVSALLAALQEHLASHVRTVRLSGRLRHSPACLVGEEHDLSPQLERLLLRGQGVGQRQRRILELNPRHPLVRGMHAWLENGQDRAVFTACADLLFGAATLAEGSPLPDGVAFNSQLIDLLSRTVANGRPTHPDVATSC